MAAPEAEAELAVGFFGSRFERATPGEREYLRAMADAAVAIADRGEEELDDIGVPTADVAAALGKKPQSLSPGARLAAEEGADLLRRARPDRLHRAALRALPARARQLRPSATTRIIGEHRPALRGTIFPVTSRRADAGQRAQAGSRWTTAYVPTPTAAERNVPHAMSIGTSAAGQPSTTARLVSS